MAQGMTATSSLRLKCGFASSLFASSSGVNIWTSLQVSGRLMGTNNLAESSHILSLDSVVHVAEIQIYPQNLHVNIPKISGTARLGSVTKGHWRDDYETLFLCLIAWKHHD